jgi:hypothetical protein
MINDLFSHPCRYENIPFLNQVDLEDSEPKNDTFDNECDLEVKKISLNLNLTYPYMINTLILIHASLS